MKPQVKPKPIKVLPAYKGLEHFCDHHKVSGSDFVACFGKDFYTRNPMFSNDKAINKLAKHLGMGIKVKTVFPTNSSVEFKVMPTKVSKTPIAWIDVNKSDVRPEATKQSLKETFIDGASERVMVHTKDGREHFARYHVTTQNWMVEGTTGFSNDYVTHFAFINSPIK